MSKTKNLRYLAIYMVALISFCLVSCGDDDNDLVGKWRCSDHYYAGTDYYIFNSDGTYKWYYENTGSVYWHFDDRNGRYSYDSNSGILTTSDNKGSTNVYIIASNDKSHFVMIDEDGDRYTYYK